MAVVKIQIEDTLRGTLKVTCTPNFDQMMRMLKDGAAAPSHELAASTLAYIWRTLQNAKVVRVKQPNNLE